MKLLVILVFLFSVATAWADQWNGYNDPSLFDRGYNYNFSELPLKATLPINKMPWSSSYWPRNRGSINYRWNAPNPTGFNLNRFSKESVQSMSQEQLAELSPAEKFDLAQGRYDYPLSSNVAAGASPRAKHYEGICDGWTASAIQFDEPAPVTIKNPDGLMIPFGSSDVKALMSYDVSLNRVDIAPAFVGRYCTTGSFGMRLGLANCVDINPGAFHVILANQIALKKEAFATDIDPGKETWNQPVFGYEFEIRGETRASGAAQAYLVHAKMMYGEDDPENGDVRKVFNWNPTLGTDNFSFAVMELDYVLELDGAGRIMGGSWIGGSVRNHPDLFWMPTKKIQWSPEFQFLNQLYKPAH
ncbi:hypothetical protein WDW86_01590 [Bdellovibrionota bacterium FG-2]